MENTSYDKTQLINKLIQINNDRIEGYETAIALLPNNKTPDVRQIFEELRDQSLAFKNELAPTLKSTLSAHTLSSILDSCELGEHEFSEAYRHALEDSIGARLELTTIIERQSNLQQETYNKLKEWKACNASSLY